MKQILISTLILSLVYSSSNAMEAPATPEHSASMVSVETFINFMDNACLYTDSHVRVQYCTYCLRVAVREGNDKIFDKAFELWNWYKKNSLDFDFTRTELSCPFVKAAANGYWYGAQKLLERSKGQIINDSCKTHNVKECYAVETSALASAAKYGHANFITYLLAYASDTPINPDQIVNKKTALMEAIEHDKLACTQALLQGKLKMANPNVPLPDKSFGSILHWALSLHNRNQHVKLLLQHGADKNLVRKEKEYQQEGTPLMVAVAFANEQGVKMLLEKGADICIKHPYNNQTVLELAELKVKVQQSDERLNIVEILKQALAKQSGATPGAV